MSSVVFRSGMAFEITEMPGSGGMNSREPGGIGIDPGVDPILLEAPEAILWRIITFTLIRRGDGLLFFYVRGRCVWLIKFRVFVGGLRGWQVCPSSRRQVDHFALWLEFLAACLLRLIGI
jgi:hypothetical protein